MSTTTTTAHTTPALNPFLPLLARLLMCSLFIWDGVLQLRNPAGTADYFASLDVPMPNIAVWVSIPIHLLAGLAILVGYKTGQTNCLKQDGRESSERCREHYNAFGQRQPRDDRAK
jgi:uncharacterized membrane protein YphA (DoxX/SURF4 family)